MSQQQNRTEKKPSNPGKIALMGAIATGLALFNMFSGGGEAPSQALLFLQYVLLACGLIALVGGLFMMAVAPK